jgi:hypothetical protein
LVSEDVAALLREIRDNQREALALQREHMALYTRQLDRVERINDGRALQVRAGRTAKFPVVVPVSPVAARDRWPYLRYLWWMITHDCLMFRGATRDLDALVALVTPLPRESAARAGPPSRLPRRQPHRSRGAARDIERPAQPRAGRRTRRRTCSPARTCAKTTAPAISACFPCRPRCRAAASARRCSPKSERIVRDEWALPAMRMTVIDIRDELIAFYERRGYARTGIKKPFPYGDARFGFPRATTCASKCWRKRL